MRGANEDAAVMPTPEPDISADPSSKPAANGIEAAPAARTIDGRWIVLGVLIAAVVLAVVGLKFRQPSPKQRNVQTQPSTAPATPTATTNPTNR